MLGLNIDLSTLLLVIILASLLVAVAARKTSASQPNLDHAGPFTALSLTQAFNPDYVVLWQTQLPALDFISSAGRRGRQMGDLAALYALSARQYPELYEGTGFAGWLKFLMESGLVVVSATTVTITHDGQLFVQTFARESHGGVRPRSTGRTSTTVRL